MLRSVIEVSPTDLAMDLVQVLLIGALTGHRYYISVGRSAGPEIMCQNFDLTHKPTLTHCLGPLAGINFFTCGICDH